MEYGLSAELLRPMIVKLNKKLRNSKSKIYVCMITHNDITIVFSTNWIASQLSHQLCVLGTNAHTNPTHQPFQSYTYNYRILYYFYWITSRLSPHKPWLVSYWKPCKYELHSQVSISVLSKYTIKVITHLQFEIQINIYWTFNAKKIKT